MKIVVKPRCIDLSGKVQDTAQRDKDIDRRASRGGCPHRHTRPLELLQKRHRHETALRPPSEEELAAPELQVFEYSPARVQHVESGLLMAAFHHVALGLVGQAHTKVVRTREDVSLPRELRDHELGFGRLLGEEGTSCFP